MALNPATGADLYEYALDVDGVAAWRRAASFAQRAQYASAIDTLAGLLHADPGFVPALVQIAHWALALDRYRDARALARRAAAVVDRSPALVLEVVRLLRRFEDPRRISDVMTKLDWRACDSVVLLVSLAAELLPAGLYADARDILEAAEALDPSSSAMLGLRATLDLTTGEHFRARPALERIASQGGPAAAHAHWLLSLRPGWSADAGGTRVDELRRQMARVERGSEAEALLAFALHNVLHARGEFEQAWQALARGCEIKRARLRYHEGRERALMEAITALPKFDPLGGAKLSDPIPVYVVGMHRSGTTLLERMLAGHDDVADGGESYVFSAAFRYATNHYAPKVIDLEGVRRAAHGLELRGIAQDFLEYARWKASGRACFTEKLPSNFLHLGTILAALPQARVLHMRRDPVDTCFSNLRTYFAQAAPYSYDQKDVAAFYRMYETLMSHWHALWPGRILDIDYDKLVEEPGVQARRAFEFCGLNFQPSTLDVARREGIVATASVGQARDGIHKDRGGAWRSYAQHLHPLLDAFGQR